jgi:MFS family permease
VEKQQGQFYLFGQRRFLPFFATQFLGALNDNLFKNALLVIVVSGGVSATASDANFLTNLAAGLFILPYFLFSTTAGQLADKYDKAWLIKRIKFAEILIMLVGCYALLTKNVGMMMGVLFALGAQSAFFGPIKYAIIPQHLATHELMSGNAQVGMGTFVSILLGTLLGAWLVSYDQGTLLVGMLAMLVAVAGWLSSCQIPSAPADSDEIVLSFNRDAAQLSLCSGRYVGVLLHCQHFVVLALWRQLLNASPEFCGDGFAGPPDAYFCTTGCLYCWCGDWLGSLRQVIQGAGGAGADSDRCYWPNSI